MATPIQPPHVIGLKRSPSKNPDNELYSFGWGPCGGLIINGFTYNRTSGAIHPPALTFGNKKVPLVKGYGKSWRVLREKVEEEIGRYVTNGSEDGQPD